MRERAAVPATNLAGRLDAGLEELQLPLPTLARQQLLHFVGLLQQWNRVYNLTSVREPSDMLTVHVLDALSVLPVIEQSMGTGGLLDVGSGAGLPGIPLAIARPEWRIASVDAVAKKIAFQTHAKQALHLNNLHPVHRRVEALTLDREPAVIVARAYANLRAMVESVAHLVGSDTRVVAMKGADPAAEIAALPPEWRVDRTIVLAVPFLGAERRALVLRRA